MRETSYNNQIYHLFESNLAEHQFFVILNSDFPKPQFHSTGKKHSTTIFPLLLSPAQSQHRCLFRQELYLLKVLELSKIFFKCYFANQMMILKTPLFTNSLFPVCLSPQLFRSNPPQVLFEKGVLKICSKFTEKNHMPKCDFNNAAKKLY